ncbi:hypothetical protein N8647_01790, partial [bacterium]|nr:hypothetical protein [bacterium]
IIISDMPLTSWKHILPERRVLIIDIQQHRFEQRGLNFKSREPRRLKDLAKENSRATHPQQPDGLNPQR